VGGASGDILLCDVCGGFGEGLLRRILCDTDRIIAVIDPLPSAMMANPARLELLMELENAGLDLRYVLNKMNRGVNRRELRAFYRMRLAAEIPFFDPAQIYLAEYNCCTLHAMPKLNAELARHFAALR
jgi:CO dehydrogenase nickel-insertion accessory protein CooC1